MTDPRATWTDLGIMSVFIGGMSLLLATMLRRQRRWTRVDAVVCHGDEREASLNRKRRPRGWHVMFEGPHGLCVARYGSDGGDEGPLAVGEVVTIVYDPADPSRVLIVQPRWALIVGFIFLAAMWLIGLLAVLSHGTSS